MRALKVIGNCCLVFLAIISVCVSLAYLYVHFFDNTITTGTNYIDNQTPVDLVEKEEDLTQDQIDYYEQSRKYSGVCVRTQYGSGSGRSAYGIR